MTSLSEHLRPALGDGSTILFTALRVTVIYLALLFALRLTGRRQRDTLGSRRSAALIHTTH